MTNQEAFNRAVTWLLAQGKKSIRSSGTINVCLYRGPDGLRCAVGTLIPDAEYHPAMEGKRAAVVCGLAANQESLPPFLVAPSLVGLNAALLTSLQLIHDGLPVVRWPEALRACGKRFDLSWPLDEPSVTREPTDSVALVLDGHSLAPAVR
jgi:hypothetical protein